MGTSTSAAVPDHDTVTSLEVVTPGMVDASVPRTYAEFMKLPWWKRWFTSHKFPLEEVYIYESTREARARSSRDFKAAKKKVKHAMKHARKGNLRTMTLSKGLRVIHLVRDHFSSLTIKKNSNGWDVIDLHHKDLALFEQEYQVFMELDI